MDDVQPREEFDTGLKKIRLEIKSRLVPHGLYGTVTSVDRAASMDAIPDGSTIEVVAKDRTAERSFDRRQIEGCCLRVSGAVLVDIIAMIDEVSNQAASSP
jgi:hypothetical protein